MLTSDYRSIKASEGNEKHFLASVSPSTTGFLQRYRYWYLLNTVLMFMLTLVLPSLFVSISCHDCAMLYTLLPHKSGIWPHGKYTDKSKCVIGLKFKGAAKSWASVIWPRFTEARRAVVSYINRRTKPLWLPSCGEDAEEIHDALWQQWFAASAKHSLNERTKKFSYAAFYK